MSNCIKTTQDQFHKLTNLVRDILADVNDFSETNAKQCYYDESPALEVIIPTSENNARLLFLSKAPPVNKNALSVKDIKLNESSRDVLSDIVSSINEMSVKLSGSMELDISAKSSMWTFKYCDGKIYSILLQM